MARTKKRQSTMKSDSYLDRISEEVESNQSRLTMVLGGLIMIVVVVLLFNYFNKDKSEVGPSQQTEEQTQKDVTPENLPGKYVVKTGDTLFSIAESYYKNGYKYTEIAKANNIADPNNIEVSQELQIPKLTDQDLSNVSMSERSQAEATPTPETNTDSMKLASPKPQSGKVSDGTNTQSWGSAINGGSYTVVKGDWLSTIAARAYNGDILSYAKLAQANNIQDPNLIIPGQVLTIPR